VFADEGNVGLYFRESRHARRELSYKDKYQSNRNSFIYPPMR
jgi:hypothetical protein